MKILDKNELGSDSDATIVFIEPSADSYLSLKKKKKKKRLDSTIGTNNSISGTQENESQSLLSMIQLEKTDPSHDCCSEKKKKKKRKSESVLSVIEDSFASVGSLNGKKKHSENVIEDSFVSSASSGSLNGKRKKRKNSEISENGSLLSVIEDSFNSVQKEKQNDSTIDSDNSTIVKKKKKKRQRNSENNDSQSTIDSDNSFDKKKKHKSPEKQLPLNEIDSDTIIVRKKKKKSQRNSENNDSQSTIDSDNSTIVNKKKKKRQRNSENYEIEPSLINIDSDGSFISKKKHKNSENHLSFDEVEPSLLTIDSSGSFIEKKKRKNSETLQNQLVSNGGDSSDDIIDKKKKRKYLENGDSIISEKRKKNDSSYLIVDEGGCPKEEKMVNSDSDKKKKIKIESDEEKRGKMRRAMKSEEIFSGNNSFYNSTPKKHKKKGIKEEFLDSIPIKQEKVESVENKQERLSDTCEVLDELLSPTNGDKVKLEQFSPSQEFSKEVQEETVKDDSIDDFQLKLAVSELSKDIDFDIPQLHKILNRASKPTPAQRALVKAKGLKTKRGKFTSDEDATIMENWENLVQMAGIEDRPQLFFCLRNSRISPLAKQNFLYYLSRNLPDRTPCTIFNRFKLLMTNAKKGRFSQEEDDYIKSIISTTTTSNRPVKQMAEHLKRTRLAIEHRISKLLQGHTRKIKWRKNNAAAFIKYLLRATDCTEVEDLRNRPITRLEWNYLSKKLDGVPVRILVRVWKERLHPALFIRHDQLDLRKVKMKLVKMFKENDEKEWKRVNWRRYASKFKGLTVLRVYSLMKQMVMAYVPKEKRGNLKKCIKLLSKMPEENLHKHVLYKMVYKDGAVREMRGTEGKLVPSL